VPKIEAFEKHSAAYDEWFIRNEAAYLSELKAVREFIPADRNGLEIGVGSGKFALPLGIRTGVDPSHQMADLSRKRGIDVVEEAAEALPFDNSSFDFILMVTTICFVDDLKQSFQEANRVVNDQGFIVIGFVDKESGLGREYQKKKEKSRFYREASFYTVDEVVEVLKKTGFIDFQFRQTLFSQHSKWLTIEPVKKGSGEGAFIVIRGSKKGK